MLHFILQGQGHYYLNNKHYKLNKNQCFLTEPKTITLYKAEPNKSMDLCMGFVSMVIMFPNYLNNQT